MLAEQALLGDHAGGGDTPTQLSRFLHMDTEAGACEFSPNESTACNQAGQVAANAAGMALSLGVDNGDDSEEGGGGGGGRPGSGWARLYMSDTDRRKKVGITMGEEVGALLGLSARVAALHRPAPSRTTRHTGHISMDGVNKDEDDAAADASEAAAMDEDEDDAKKGAEEVGAGAAGTEAPKSEEEKDETAAAETATAAAAEAAGSKVEKTEKSLKRISWEDPNAIVIQLGNIDDWVVEYDKASRTAWCCLHTAEAW
jgi:hypothetical protein